MSGCEIPAIATILQSTDFLSASDASAKVVKVGDFMFAVKYSGSVTFLEAQNSIFVAKHSNVPVPETYGTLTEESTKIHRLRVRTRRDTRESVAKPRSI
jgi:hypothetical protein